jgi:hypothetical protein
MPNARCVRALATLILFAAGYAVVATSAHAVPSLSPAGAARMEREKALKMQEQAAPTQSTTRTECMRENKATAHC